MQRARAAGVPHGWLSTLEGTAYLHSGEPLLRRQVLQQALEADEDNVAAQAMLGVVHTWNGDWNEWSLLEERLQTVLPRSKWTYPDERHTGAFANRFAEDAWTRGPVPKS